MAIPFTRPSEEEADSQSQEQLEQLMLDLYSVLQQVIRARNAQYQTRNRKYFLLFSTYSFFNFLRIPKCTRVRR